MYKYGLGACHKFSLIHVHAQTCILQLKERMLKVVKVSHTPTCVMYMYNLLCVSVAHNSSC